MAEKIGEATRKSVMEICRKALEENGYEVLVTGSNAFSIPNVEDGNETAVKGVFSIPKGERGGNGYDPYEEAQAYEFREEVKRKKKEPKKKKES